MEVPAVVLLCVLSPLLTWAVEVGCKKWFDIGFLTILLNGAITFVGLWAMSYSDKGR
jgi:hypothetical protein